MIRACRHPYLTRRLLRTVLDGRLPCGRLGMTHNIYIYT